VGQCGLGAEGTSFSAGSNQMLVLAYFFGRKLLTQFAVQEKTARITSLQIDTAPESFYLTF
jgi:hypothetical protein